MEGPVVCGATDITRIVCILSIVLAMINDDPGPRIGPRTAAVHSPGRPCRHPRFCSDPARTLKFPHGVLIGLRLARRFTGRSAHVYRYPRYADSPTDSPPPRTLACK